MESHKLLFYVSLAVSLSIWVTEGKKIVSIIICGNHEHAVTSACLTNLKHDVILYTSGFDPVWPNLEKFTKAVAEEDLSDYDQIYVEIHGGDAWDQYTMKYMDVINDAVKNLRLSKVILTCKPQMNKLPGWLAPNKGNEYLNIFPGGYSVSITGGIFDTYYQKIIDRAITKTGKDYTKIVDYLLNYKPIINDKHPIMVEVIKMATTLKDKYKQRFTDILAKSCGSKLQKFLDDNTLFDKATFIDVDEYKKETIKGDLAEILSYFKSEMDDVDFKTPLENAFKTVGLEVQLDEWLDVGETGRFRVVNIT